MPYDTLRPQRAATEQDRSATALARQSDGASGTTAQMRLAAALDDSPSIRSQMQLRSALQRSPAMVAQRRLAARLSHRPPLQRAEMPDDDDDVVQARFVDAPEPVQRQRANRTGLPDQLRAGMESLSGMAMDDVRVHYNSPEPRQLQALAFAQGSDIHLAPGQERHLPHEAWHVVQQRQGRVQPTLQAKGVAINDDKALESEADRMGERLSSLQNPAQLRSVRSPQRTGTAILQAKIKYPLAISGGALTKQSELVAWLMQQYPTITSPEMFARYVDGLQRQPTTFTTTEDISRRIISRLQYDVLGGEKWREFIDAKDHAAAEAAVSTGKISHPGEFYDYRNQGGDEPIKVGNHFSAFMDADSFVSDRLNTRLTAAEYVHINTLATQGITSAELKGVRTNEVTWSLPPNVTEEQRAALAEKGLDDLRPGMHNTTTVHVPMPQEGMMARIQGLLDRYYEAVDSGDSVARFSAIISLYESLEALHAFKDGTSRTNHLVLNKLLAENGLDPAILHEPNSPTSSHAQFGRHVLRGIQQTRDIARTIPVSGTPRSLGALAGQRNKRDSDEEMDDRMVKMGMQRERPARPGFNPQHDVATDPFLANVEHLIRAERDYIAMAAQPVALAVSGANAVSGAASASNNNNSAIVDRQDRKDEPSSQIIIAPSPAPMMASSGPPRESTPQQQPSASVVGANIVPVPNPQQPSARALRNLFGARRAADYIKYKASHRKGDD